MVTRGFDWGEWPYGVPRPERERLIEQGKRDSSRTMMLKYHGRATELPVIALRIEAPLYRLGNGRTTTLQQEYLSKNQGVRRDLFTADEDSVEAQRAQHDILLKLVSEEGLRKEFERDGSGQEEPLIVDPHGVVINGNRRLCLWRDLYYGDRRAFERFAMIQVAVLPDADQDAIEELEINLQIKKEHKAQYHWHALAAMMLSMRESGMTPTEIGSRLGLSNQAVNKRIDAYQYAATMLRERGNEGEWSLVDNDMEAFEQGAAARRRLADNPNKVDMFDAMAKILLSSPDEQKNGRLYDTMKDLGTYIDPIAKSLQDLIEIPEENMAPADEDERLLLGDEDEPIDLHSRVARALREIEGDGERAAEVIGRVRDVIDSEKEAEKDHGRSDYVKRMVQRACGALREAVEHVGPERDRTGVAKNLDSITGYVAELESWLNGRGE